MAEGRSGASAGLITAILLVSIALGIGNVFVFTRASQQITGGEPTEPILNAVQDTYGRTSSELLYLGAAPVAFGFLISLLVAGRRQSAAAPAEAPEAEGVAGPPPEAPVLRFLALLQQEGRLIDFLEEDISSYSDAQVGAAVRSIHNGCRNALHERMQIERIYAEEDGAEIELEAGFDPAAVRLTGNVSGRPPFKGTLQHGGWRATDVNLPQAPSDLDPTVLAPAEVEIP